MPGFFDEIVKRKGKEPMRAAWVTDGEGAGSRALFSRNEAIFRDPLFPETLVREIRGLPPEREGLLETGGSRVFLERISGGKKLVICGAGHVSLCVIRLGVMLGYEVTVIEDREEYAAKAREAGAGQVICKPFREALDRIEGDLSTAFVIMTREHAHDVECLRRILKKSFAYAGMMGSRGRTDQVRKQLLEEGFEPEKVRTVHMPIGLPIGSRTPEEIAVSVTAELISVLNESDPGEGYPPGMAEELAGGVKGVLTMIVEKNGEAPRRPGTKMLVRKDGSFLGTVGGGYAEAVILEQARTMIAEKNTRSRLVHVSMKKGAMYCGGEITVFLLALKNNSEFTIQNS